VKRHAIAGAVTALAVTAIAIAAELYALSPRGSALEMHPSLALIFPIMLCAFLFVIACILLAPQSTRRIADAAAMFCLAYIIVGIPGVVAAEGVRRYAFSRLAERSAPLVAAIHAFEADHRRPPSSLNELVPGYLSAVPGTGMGAYPHYEYAAGEIATGMGNDWVLIVDASEGPFSWDKYVYYPDGRGWVYVPGD
jgi:hypothetical protein